MKRTTLIGQLALLLLLSFIPGIHSQRDPAYAEERVPAEPSSKAVPEASAQPVSNPEQDVSEVRADADIVSIKDLVRAAEERNPAIEAARQTVEASRLRVIPERTLPDPLVSFQTMGDLIPPTLQEGDPSSGRFYAIEQEIPFPGKLGLRGKIAEVEAEAQSWNYQQVRRQVIADLKRTYYDYHLAYQSAGIVQEIRELLRNITEVAEAKYQVGEGVQQDVIKAQVEVSRLIDRLTVLEQKQDSAVALINSLLNRPPDAPLGRPAEVEKDQLPYSLEELIRLAEANAPALNRQERNVERERVAVQLARREYFPDFTVGFTYVERSDIPEMYGLMVGARVPLYFWRKQRPQLQAARTELSASIKEREREASTLGYSVREAYITATTADKLTSLYRTTLIPQARLGVESAIASYQVGLVDFLTLQDSVVILLEYELRYYEALTDFQKALAQLEPLVGIELTKQAE